MISNETIVNYKAIVLIEIYNFGIVHFYIQVRSNNFFKKINFIVHRTQIAKIFYM